MNWTAADLAAHYAKLSQGQRVALKESFGVDAASFEKHAPKATGRIPVPKGMNKTEQTYSAYLDEQKAAGAVLWSGYEPLTFKLAHDCRYTPDFAVLMADHSITMIDTKAGIRSKAGASTYLCEEDSKIKIRVAARLFPFFKWAIAYKDKRTGEWIEVIFQ